MTPRLLMLLLVACALMASCSTEGEHVERALDETREHAQRRDYGAAHALLDRAIENVPSDARLPLEKAKLFERAHAFESARDWYAEVLKLDPRSVEAVVGSWRARYEGRGDDSAVADEIRAEARALLAESPDSLFNLTAYVRAHYVLGVEDEAPDEVARLKALYPDSDLASELIKEDLDWIGVERDDETRLAMADQFLDDYPRSKWRARALRLKLVSLRRLERHDEVLETSRDWLASHADDPEVLDIVAAAMVASRRAPDEAAGLARRAVELGAARPACDEEADERTAQAELAGGEDAGRHLTLARALVLAGDHASALEAAQEGLSKLDAGPDAEETGAAWHFTMGEALEGLGRNDEALDSYVRALVVGGRQNRWPARADTALRRLYETEYKARAGGAEVIEFARRKLEYSGPVFTDVTADAGLDGRRESRVAWGDYDGDGREDLLLSGGVLMRNGGGTFEDVTENAGIGGTGANGGVWADVDNDGDLDLYATSGATAGDNTDRLWLNRGDGTFADATVAAGHMTDRYTTEGAAWGDIEGDGWVDLYLASYERPRSDTFTEYGVGYPDILYRNERDGTFRDVTVSLGLLPPFGKHLSGRGVNWGDYDNDGDLDVFVSNYRLQENFLWRNEGGASFTNVAAEVGVSGTETDGWWGHTIGSEWGDYDNDGDLDLVASNLAHPRYIEVSDKTMLYRNTLRAAGGGPACGLFLERRSDAGVKYAETHSDPSWGDVDNDGDLDLFITSIYSDCGSFLYLNDGSGSFTDVTWLAGARTFNGWGAAMCDYDGDGDLDLAVGSRSGMRLLRNDGASGSAAGERHWLQVRCQGTRSNATCIGARVVVRSGSGTQTREIEGGKGTTSQHSMTAHFGLGRRAGPVEVEIRFPRGQTVVLDDVSVDQLITVIEPD